MKSKTKSRFNWSPFRVRPNYFQLCHSLNGVNPRIGALLPVSSDGYTWKICLLVGIKSSHEFYFESSNTIINYIFRLPSGATISKRSISNLDFFFDNVPLYSDVEDEETFNDLPF